MRRQVPILCALAALAGCGSGDGPKDDATQPALYQRWSYPPGGEAKARGVVLTLHGGSWRLSGERAALTMQPVVDDLTAQGYAVLNGTYLPGADGIKTVESLYAQAKERAGDRAVCVYGESAGGSWALELAIRHPELRCVVAEAPPTDLEALARASAGARRLLTDTFGEDLRSHSPIRGPFPKATRILIGGITNDRIVPWEQAQRFQAAWPQAKLVPVKPGRTRWVHAFASRASLERFKKARDRFLRR